MLYAVPERQVFFRRVFVLGRIFGPRMGSGLIIGVLRWVVGPSVSTWNSSSRLRHLIYLPELLSVYFSLSPKTAKRQTIFFTLKNDAPPFRSRSPVKQNPSPPNILNSIHSIMQCRYGNSVYFVRLNLCNKICLIIGIHFLNSELNHLKIQFNFLILNITELGVSDSII